MPSVAVVILNWNGEHFLRRFLPGVCQHSAGVAEVVVADNGSHDGSYEAVRELSTGVHWVDLGRNWGYAEGYNRALGWVRSHLGSEVYVLLNNDVEVGSGWLQPLLRRMGEHATIGAVMPKILKHSSPNLFEYAGACGGFLDRYGYPYCRGRILESVEEDQGQYDTAMKVDWASGACLVVRSAVFWHVGGFAGDFFAHMEEIDLCWRLRRAGLEVWVEPEAAVLHVGGGSMEYANPRKLYLNHRNGLWMLRRNLFHRRRRVLLMRLLLDLASAFYRLFCGKWRHSLAVVRGICAGMLGKQARQQVSPLSGCAHGEASGRGGVCIVYEYFARRRRSYWQLKAVGDGK